MRILRKVVADLLNASGRSGLVILAMVTGLVGVISVTATKAVLSRELQRSFDAIAPASATIRSAPFSPSVLDSVARVPGVGAVDAGRVLSAWTRIGDQRTPVLLFTVADYARITVNKLRKQTGSWPPPVGTVLLERAAVQVAGIGMGETLAVRLGNAPPVPLQVAGTVHDFSQAPAWQEGVIFGYVAPETMAGLTESAGFTELRFIVAGDRLNVAHIREVARRVAATLDRNGSRVRDIQIPPPGEHPHQAQMNSLLAMQQAFGAVVLLLSASLIIVLLNAMLVQQRRQIGSMKAMGAGRGAILWMYVVWVLVLASCALIIALPAGLAAGRAYAVFIADMLNFDVVDEGVPASLLATLIGVGVLLPLLVALLPILRASAITTRAALSDVATIPSWNPQRRRGFSRDSRLWRLAMLGVANAHRVRGRFAVVVATLAVSGALFLSALNVDRSLQETLAVNFARLGYDIALGVGEATPVRTIDATLGAIPGIARVETSATARAMVIDERDESPRAFPVTGLRTLQMPAPLTQLAGRWLREDDGRVVVANHGWLREHSQYAIGDSIVLRIGSDSARWFLAGTAREIFVPGQLYTRAEVLERTTKGEGTPGVTQVHVVTDAHDLVAVGLVMQRIEQTFAAQGIVVTSMSGLRNIRQHREDHMRVIISFLVVIAILSQVVGGFGLATMLSVGLFERSQELGVMRALGATRGQLAVTVIVEGIWIAAVAWAGSILLSLFSTWVLNGVLGRMWLATPLDYHTRACAIPWLAVVAGTIAIVASGIPAWQASTREPRALLIAT